MDQIPTTRRRSQRCHRGSVSAGSRTDTLLANVPFQRTMSFRVAAMTLAAFVLMMLAVPCWGQSTEEVQEVWEYAPYRIEIWLTFEKTARLTGAHRSQLAEQLIRLGDQSVGAPWTISVLEEAQLMERAKAAAEADRSAAAELMAAAESAGYKPPEAGTDTEEAEDSTSSSKSKKRKSFKPGEKEFNQAVELKERAERAARYGQTISADILTDMEMVQLTQVEEMSPQTLQSQNKLVLMSVRFEHGAYAVSARELDCQALHWSPVYHGSSAQPERFSNVAFATLLRSFRPITRLEKAKGKEAQVRARGAGLISDNKSPAFVGEGTVLLPIIRKNDRYGKPLDFGGIRAAPWTFLKVSKMEGSTLTCAIHSGMRGVLEGRISRRTQKFGLRTEAAHPYTVLKCVTNDRNNPKPLPGYELHAKGPDDETSELVGITDWRGVCKIPPQKTELSLVYVKNGGQLLARLPMIPGLELNMEAKMRDDDLRLQAEGFIKGIQSSVMDVVASRHLEAMRARDAMKKKDWDKADFWITRFRSIQSRGDFDTTMELQRSRFYSDNERVLGHIDKLFSETGNTVAKYVDDREAVTLSLELQAAKEGRGPSVEPDPEPEDETDDSSNTSEDVATDTSSEDANDSTTDSGPAVVPEGWVEFTEDQTFTVAAPVQLVSQGAFGGVEEFSEQVGEDQLVSVGKMPLPEGVDVEAAPDAVIAAAIQTQVAALGAREATPPAVMNAGDLKVHRFSTTDDDGVTTHVGLVISKSGVIKMSWTAPRESVGEEDLDSFFGSVRLKN